MAHYFRFDSSLCTGCKACQVACKDKNNLPAGVSWRRVVEVSGGDWMPDGYSWQQSIFSYNLSISCSHCIHPKCAGVCPTNAYNIDKHSGIVILDPARCAGCGYCNWACPYGVPQYDAAAGRMSKCNFCTDYLAESKSPACVSACPMRALNFGSDENIPVENPGIALWNVPGDQHPFPLPSFSRTQPHLFLIPHPQMAIGRPGTVTNKDEFKTSKGKNESPLAVFTLCSQAAVGSYLVSPLMLFAMKSLAAANIVIWFYLPVILALFLFAVGGLFAFLHLGTKKNSIRMLNNLKKSWLSREILAAGVFGLALASNLLFSSPLLFVLTSLTGIWFIYAMAQVYYLRSIPEWNNWKTTATFFSSVWLFGWLSAAGYTAISGFQSALPGLALMAGVSFELFLKFNSHTFLNFRSLDVSEILLIVIGVCSAIISFGHTNYFPLTLALLVILIFAQQINGRLNFYRHLENKVL